MRSLCTRGLAAAVILLSLLPSVRGEVAARAVVPGFQLPAGDGQVVSVAPGGQEKLTVVAFLGAECPLARLYAARLAEFAREFAPQGVRFLGINSNRQDSADEVRAYARRHEIPFPVVKDYGNRVADLFAAERTPEVFVLDRDLLIRYRGRIDDQYLPGVKRAGPGRADLRIAIEELLAGKSVTVPVTEAAGCYIGREKEAGDDAVEEAGDDSGVTFCKQVARVLNTHCVECHRPDEIGPFSLTDYEEIVGWADTIVEVIDDGRMPPWHASPEHGEFLNARHMPEQDREILREWVAAGMPYGDARDLPPPPAFVDGWLLPREPDLVLSMRERPFVVHADGTVEYQYFVVDPEFSEDKWVSAAQVVPGNRSVVHHSIVFIRPPDGTEFRGVGWLSGYVPGQRTYGYGPGTARRVPAGSKLVFQMHYTPTGTEESDITKIGIVFAQADEVTHEVITPIAIEQGFEIPPFEQSYTVQARVRQLPEKGELLSIMPHMHLRGKSFELTVTRGDKRAVLLHVPRYDFNWQHNYVLVKPLPLADIDGLECDVTFDNSRENPFNPDPSQYVTWGDQTWEEMAVAFFDVSVPLAKEDAGSGSAASGDAAIVQAVSPQRVEAFVTRFVERFDADGDGEVLREETPASMRAFGFPRLDWDGDGRLSRDEIRQLAAQRLKQ
jgi:peroxiredoxin